MKKQKNIKLNKKYINPKTGRKYTYYDRQGNGIADILTWAKGFEEKKKKVVKQKGTWLGFWVSTVWLGLDHSFGASEKPLIFESMVFFHGHIDLDMDRYSTEEEAIAGHNKMFRNWSNPFYIIWKILDRKTWMIRWRINKMLNIS